MFTTTKFFDSLFKVAGVHHRTVKNFPDGTFDLNEVRSKWHDPYYDDDHEAWTALVCIENTHNKCGGIVLPQNWIKEVVIKYNTF